MRCDGSAALDLCAVASGRLDGYWEKGLSQWDMAAGIVIAREAGAIVTDYNGGADSLARGEVIVANPHLHPQILKEINR
jgi:myo-inositol-1(or 4)-monophosphatase